MHGSTKETGILNAIQLKLSNSSIRRHFYFTLDTFTAHPYPRHRHTHTHTCAHVHTDSVCTELKSTFSQILQPILIKKVSDFLLQLAPVLSNHVNLTLKEATSPAHSPLGLQ